MVFLKLKKLVITSLAVLALVLSFSAVASAAELDELSVVDNTLYASVSEGNIAVFVAEYDEALLSDVFFAYSDEDGYIELSIGNAEEYKILLWDRNTLAPVSCTYKLVEGRAYAEGSTEPVPEYTITGYSFDQEDYVMIVSAITDNEITGYKAGEATTYSLGEHVTVVGLSDKLDDVVPGSVVLIGTDASGNCAAIELLASMGMPVDPANFENNFGFYSPSDGSEKYQNFVTEMYSKSGNNLVFYHFNEDGKFIPTYVNAAGKTVKQSYPFVSGAMCYRVGIAMDGETPIVTISSSKASATGEASLFKDTSEYHNYVYLRYDTETQKLTQCVLYCVPKDFNPGAGGDGWTQIFGLGPVVIIE